MVDNTASNKPGKAYLRVFDFTASTPSYSTIIIASDKKTYVYTPGIDNNYYEIASGIDTLKALAFATGYIYAPIAVGLDSNTNYTSFIYNQTATLPAIGVIKDNLTAPATNYSKIRILFFVHPSATNNPTTLSISNSKDSIFSYNRTSLDFFLIAPLTSFTNITSGIYTVAVNGSTFSNLITLKSGTIYTLIVRKTASGDFEYDLFVQK